MASERNIKLLTGLRKNLVKKDPFSILLANFEGSLQQKDIEKRTALMQKFFRIKINIKEFDDNERAKRGLEPFDFDNVVETLNALRNEFDMPFWAFYSLNNGNYSKLDGVKDYDNVFIYQIKGCNINCPWCYADDISKNGKPGQGSKFFTIPEIMDIFEEEREKQTINMFRPSGGEPTIAIEQWLYILQELEKRGLDKEVYVQSDTNITAGHFIKLLEEKEEIEKGLLEKIGDYKNFGVLCSFKGTDRQNYYENTDIPKKECDGFLEENIYTFKKFVKAGIDCYPFFYNPNPNTLESFLDRFAKEVGDENVIRRSWVFLLKPYGPEKARLRKRAIREGIRDEGDIKKYIEDFCQKLSLNFEKAKEKMKYIMQKRFGETYQQEMRPGIKIKVK